MKPLTNAVTLAPSAAASSQLEVTMSLAFDSLAIDFPIIQAALSGYSDWPMRAIARRHGAEYTICEVMLDQFLVALQKREKTKHFLYIGDDEHPVGGQLMGSEPEQFALGATKLVEAGFDVIDINFGCPVKKVLGRCRGGYHLGQPRVALDIIARTRAAVPTQIPVTVKMRRGIDDSEESRSCFFEILEGAFQRGVAAVTVHGRTVQQRYVGRSNWGFLQEAKARLSNRTILGSGDLFSAADCMEMIQQTGVDGVTVARGAIGNPWIFAQARALYRGEALPPPPRVRAQGAVIREHYQLSQALYGDRCGRLMRKFGIKYAALHPRTSDVKEAFIQVRSRSDWEEVLETWYGSDEPGQYPDPSLHRSQAERVSG